MVNAYRLSELEIAQMMASDYGGCCGRNRRARFEEIPAIFLQTRASQIFSELFMAPALAPPKPSGKDLTSVFR
jgi:hypothetical protein